MLIKEQELGKLLHTIADSVSQGDSFEGFIAYGVPDERSDAEDDDLELHGSYRYGNSNGQGSLRILGDAGGTPRPPIDLQALDPGIRETVRRLREAGFDTSDSGDGRSKPADPVEVLDFPHVAIRASASSLIGEAERLRFFLSDAGLTVEPFGMEPEPEKRIGIQASYDPSNGSAIVLLTGLSDEAWPR
jgi:hypothetical protein